MNESVSDSPVRRALKNFSVLMGGRAVAGVLSVVSLTLVARFLGPVEFGLLVVVHTTAVVVRGLLNFKPSDTVVRYGVAPFDDDDHRELNHLLRFTLALDVATASLAALCMMLVMLLAGPALGLPEELAMPAVLYGLVLLASGSGTARGVLRVAGRFHAMGVQQNVGPLIRLAGVAAVYLAEGGLLGYLMVWAVAFAAEHLFMNVRGWLELKRRGVRPGRPTLAGAKRRFPGLWGFVGTLYWQSNLDLAQRHGLILLAGVLLGPAGAGMFRVAREFADVLAKPVIVVRQAVFPDFARLWRERDPRFKTLYWRLGLYGGLIAAVVVGLVGLYAGELLEALVGEEYVQGAALLVWLMVAGALELIGAALRPAAYAMGAATGALRVQIVTAVCHVSAFAVLVPWLGLAGAGIAAACSGAIALAGMVALVLTRADQDPGAAA
ncbi:MAG TPA: oligosaccharide flippase family protein [Pseudomonadales bacterium]